MRKPSSRERAQRQALREEFRKRLLADAARRFGKRRARALEKRIGKLADDLAAVALFPVADDAKPAYYPIERP